MGLGWASRGTLGRGVLTSVSYLKICIYSHSYAQTVSGNRGGTARKITCYWKEPLSQIPVLLLDSLRPVSTDGGQPRVLTPLSSDLRVVTGKPGVRMGLDPDSTPDSLLPAPAQPTTGSPAPLPNQRQITTKMLHLHQKVSPDNPEIVDTQAHACQLPNGDASADVLAL